MVYSIIFSYTVTETVDGQYGIDNTSGLIGMLFRNEIDIAVAAFYPMVTRSMAAQELIGLKKYR